VTIAKTFVGCSNNTSSLNWSIPGKLNFATRITDVVYGETVAA